MTSSPLAGHYSATSYGQYLAAALRRAEALQVAHTITTTLAAAEPAASPDPRTAALNEARDRILAQTAAYRDTPVYRAVQQTVGRNPDNAAAAQAYRVHEARASGIESAAEAIGELLGLPEAVEHVEPAGEAR